MFDCKGNPGLGISFRQFLQVKNDQGPVPVKFHGQRSPFDRFGPPERRFLGFKLTL